MTREESWEVEGTTLTLLRHISSLGYAVSVFRFPGSLLGTRPAAIEMHAIDVATDPPTQYVARFVEGALDPEYRCAVLLAQMVGIDLEDG